MKKTLITLLALCGVVAAADIELHGITFSEPTAQGLMNQTNVENANLYLTGETLYWSDQHNRSFSGLYVASDGALRINNTNEKITVNYLYLASDVTIGADKAQAVGDVTWNWALTEASCIQIQATNGGWVDINNDYDIRINLSSMESGAVYLNTAGALTLSSGGNDYTLNNGVNVYATITETANVRTLLSGDFSNWNGTVHLMTADNVAYNGTEYTWKATAQGLEIVAVPEPATATLSLLALAGLAARRRRK